ncbi:hypothetical protein PPACK8108_LOCUS4098 [Phakopsora pachyrhizi]|uniref:Uncharacterized protein n=1 Tax=Phakopsora pachyrhizi TaxID=170000 RepID=A0AAV0ALH6_PHAPC|nr:hypothetical protein PPACK8108_LOCUS4098 [Phakopsora pachyrhizi]
MKHPAVHSPRSIEVWTGQNWLDEDLPDEKYLSVPKLKIFLALNKIQFSSQAKRPELIKLYKSLQEEHNQKRYSASVPKRENQEASVTFLSTPSTTHSAVALTSPQKNKTTTSPSCKSSGRKQRSSLSKISAINQSPSNYQSETLTPYSTAVPLSAKRIERNVLPESSDRFKQRKGQASTEKEFCQNAKSPDTTPFSEASTQASLSGTILGRIKADYLASAPALHPASSKLVLCQKEDENSCFQSSAATPTSEVSTKASLSGLILESRSELLASAPSLAIESSTATSTASSSKALTSVPLEDSRSDFSALGPSSSLKSPSKLKYLTQLKLKEYLDCYDISYNFRAGQRCTKIFNYQKIFLTMTRARDASRREMVRISHLRCYLQFSFAYKHGLSSVNSLSRNQATAGRRPKPRSQNNRCIADESGFVYRPPSHHSYSTRQSTALQFSAVNNSSCYLPSRFLAINQSLSNHQSETLTPYSAAVPLSAKRIERSVLPESSDRFKQRKGQASTATPKSCGPTCTKSRSWISKKKYKDSNKPGFVYKPPSHHSYSTRQSTALQSSAVNQSSCYSPSQFSAINQSLSNHQSETLTPYSTAVPLSAERIERNVSPESSDRFKRRKGQASIPLSAERIERNVSPESSDRFKRRKGQASTSEMLEGINCIAQGINNLQMIRIQGQSTGGKKVTGEGRDNALLARVRQHVDTLFGKDLDTKKQIYLSPATRCQRRLWRNDFDNISDDDELSSQSNEDIEGQDPLFPYPGGPGFRGASSQTLSIMWRALCQSGVQSFRSDLSKPMSDRKNQLLWDLAYKLLLKLIKVGKYSDIDLEMCSEDKIYQTLVNHVKYLRRCFHEANNWTKSDQQERDQRKRQVTRRSNMKMTQKPKSKQLLHFTYPGAALTSRK